MSLHVPHRPPRPRSSPRRSVPANTVTLSGTITSIEGLRHTPAGLPVVRLQLAHASTQVEAGMNRQVDCEVGAVGVGEIAGSLSRLQAGASIQVSGFLAKKSRGSQQLILHITQIH